MTHIKHWTATVCRTENAMKAACYGIKRKASSIHIHQALEAAEHFVLVPVWYYQSDIIASSPKP